MSNLVFPANSGQVGKLPFVLKSIGSNMYQEHIKRPVGYPDHHWLFSFNGTGKLIIDNKEFELTPGTGFFCSPFISHEYYAMTRSWETHWLTLNGSGVSSLIKLLNYSPYDYFQISDSTMLSDMLREIYESFDSTKTLKLFESSWLTYKFLLDIGSYIKTGFAKSNRNIDKQLGAVISFIQDSYQKNISLDDMAKTIQISSKHLCRLFKNSFGVRPFEYLTSYRIQKAKELLTANNQMQIKEISYSVGYLDTSYFCAVFKKQEGMSPGEFKKIHVH